MKYVGDHISYNIEKDKYMGSGKLLKEAQILYGINNFSKQILQKYDTQIEARYAQRFFINKHNTLYPNGYNLTKNGGAGGNKGANKGRKASAEEKRKISQRLLGNNYMLGHIHTKETKKKISEKTKITSLGEKNGMYQKGYLVSGEKNSFFGKNHTQESKQKMSESRKGKLFSENHKINISIGLSGINNPMFGKYGINNPNFGSKRSEIVKQKMRGRIKTSEEKLKISISNKNRPKITCEHCHKKIDNLNFKKWHGDKCKNNVLIYDKTGSYSIS